MPTPNVDGIDLSHWNVVSDESQIPPLRLMSCKATQGRSFVSPAFASYWEMFKRHGATHRGSYHWVTSSTPMGVQLDNWTRAMESVGAVTAGQLEQGVMLQLDWERTSLADGSVLPDPTVAQIEEFCGLLTARFGERFIVYGAPWVPGFVDWRRRNPTVPVWLANYNTSLGPKGGWVGSSLYQASVWQWSSTYKMPGFAWDASDPNDGIDVNHVHDWPVLDRIAGYTQQEADVALVKVKTPPADSPPWWPYIGLFDSGVARPMVNNDLQLPAGVAPEQLTDVGQYRRLAVSAGVDLTNEFPDGSSDVTVTVPPFTIPPPPGFVGTVSLAPVVG